jgi:hypothetical protein
MMDEYEYWDIVSGEGLSESDLYDRYDEMLDEVYGEVAIGGLTYDTAMALREVDPIAYRCGFNDWLDAELSETITDVQPRDEED